MIHVDQIIILYTLNLHSAVPQLYLNNTRKKDLKKIYQQNHTFPQ